MTQHRETTPSNQVDERAFVCDWKTPSRSLWQFIVHGLEVRCRRVIFLRGTAEQARDKARRAGWYVSDDGELSYCPPHQLQLERSH